MTQEPPITQADRELLKFYETKVQEYLEKVGDPRLHVRADEAAIRAIAKARQLGRKQGLREAAEVCNSYAVCAHDGDIFDPDYADGEYNAAVSCEEKILALIDKPGGAV